MACLNCESTSKQFREEGSVIPDEAQLWRDRYRVLFDKNVAGAILTTTQGRIVDCNEACAQMFGFNSREECSRTPPGTSISTGQSGKCSWIGFEQEGVSFPKKFA